MQNLQMTDPKRELAPQLRELVGKSRLKLEAIWKVVQP